MAETGFRLPGARPRPEVRAELLRIWDALDPERRKALIFTARALAKDAGLLPADAPLLAMGGKAVL
ncbi:hypothetical protein M0638_27310 [Roseomonas sp. NAR14]|uniref:Uncharacterized protein n=1 Tax=Roseomonas acroporae TaxID=2937791 RepID=A0A9X2BZK6_9PROT|nr:hypothetical protein [Roseomonas acroporae]MCK8788069.1 hypothetical protein [Roseomonas acroporae]